MSRKGWVVAVGVLVGVGLAGVMVALLLTRPRHSITPATAEQVRAGMSRADIEALFGRAAGNYSRGDGQPLYGGKLIGHPGRYEVWVGDDVSVFVWFDAGGTVTGHIVGSVFYRQEGLVARILRWAHP